MTRVDGRCTKPAKAADFKCLQTIWISCCDCDDMLDVSTWVAQELPRLVGQTLVHSFCEGMFWGEKTRKVDCPSEYVSLIPELKACVEQEVQTPFRMTLPLVVLSWWHGWGSVTYSLRVMSVACMLAFVYFWKTDVYFKGKLREKEKKREIFQALVHFPNDYNGQD